MKRLKNAVWGVTLAAMLFPAIVSAGMVNRDVPTLLMVPRRYTVVQLGFDLAEHYQMLLGCYQTADDGIPVVYIWSGSEWLRVTLRDYREANFAQITPARVILIGDDQVLPPTLAEDSAWAQSVLNIPVLKTADLVNSLGKLLNFNRAEWAWFASRYRLTLQDLNEDRRRESWYDQSLERFLEQETLQDAETEGAFESGYEEVGAENADLSDEALSVHSLEASEADAVGATPGPEAVEESVVPAEVILDMPVMVDDLTD